jgi:hypothetical protein
MTVDTIQKKLLDKILESSEFSHSKIYQTYLKHLVDAAQQGKDLKETTIAIEVFGKDSSFNPAEDTIVRSHTYALRKKLESYYFHEGRDDKLRLNIPKGHYAIQFVPSTDIGYNPKNALLFLKNRWKECIIVFLIGFIFFVLLHDRSAGKMLKQYRVVTQDDPFWKEYMHSDLPILIVIGDHFFFNDYIDKYRQTITLRDNRVNSSEDFQLQYPQYHLTPAPEPYFPYHSIWSLPPIFSMLYSAKKNPILRKASEISPQILGEYNIIYLGSIKTLYNLKHTLLKSHFQFHVAPHKISYTPPDSGSVRVFETSLHSEGPNEDLVLALKLPGPVNNPIFIIASYHSLGAPEIAHFLINRQLRMDLEKKFKKKCGRVPPFFEVLFKVSGIDKTAYSTDIMVYNEIIPNKSEKPSRIQ